MGYMATILVSDFSRFLADDLLSPYLDGAPSTERLCLFGGSMARLVRTPQAEKHTSVLLESSRVTTNLCTGEERERSRTMEGQRR